LTARDARRAGETPASTKGILPLRAEVDGEDEEIGRPGTAFGEQCDALLGTRRGDAVQQSTLALQ
jgi:hypothetical protein